MKLQLKPWPPRHKNQWPFLIHPGFRSCQGAAFGVAGGSVGLVLWLWASHGNGEKTTAYMGIPAKPIKTKKQCHQMSAVRLHENLQQKRLFVWSISFGRFNGSSRHGWNICTSNQHANQISEISKLVLSTWNHIILGELPGTQSNTIFLGRFPGAKNGNRHQTSPSEKCELPRQNENLEDNWYKEKKFQVKHCACPVHSLNILHNLLHLQHKNVGTMEIKHTSSWLNLLLYGIMKLKSQSCWILRKTF